MSVFVHALKAGIDAHQDRNRPNAGSNVNDPTAAPGPGKGSGSSVYKPVYNLVSSIERRVEPHVRPYISGSAQQPPNPFPASTTPTVLPPPPTTGALPPPPQRLPYAARKSSPRPQNQGGPGRLVPPPLPQRTDGSRPTSPTAQPPRKGFAAAWALHHGESPVTTSAVAQAPPTLPPRNNRPAMSPGALSSSSTPSIASASGFGGGPMQHQEYFQQQPQQAYQPQSPHGQSPGQQPFQQEQFQQGYQQQQQQFQPYSPLTHQQPPHQPEQQQPAGEPTQPRTAQEYRQQYLAQHGALPQHTASPSSPPLASPPLTSPDGGRSSVSYPSAETEKATLASAYRRTSGASTASASASAAGPSGSRPSVSGASAAGPLQEEEQLAGQLAQTRISVSGPAGGASEVSPVGQPAPAQVPAAAPAGPPAPVRQTSLAFGEHIVSYWLEVVLTRQNEEPPPPYTGVADEFHPAPAAHT